MNNRLYVGNISYSTTEPELRGLFGEAGTVREVYIVTDRDTGKPRGFAFVEMESEAEATAAIDRFNERAVGGRTLHVNLSRPKPTPDEGSRDHRDRRPGRDRDRAERR